MRIIGGSLKGLKLNPPKNLPVRPTTDLAKEALFNILNNQLDFEGLNVLDLFSGTGSISLEFASRGAENVTSIDINSGCIKYLNDTAKQHGLQTIKTYRVDVFKYIDLETNIYDLIFADAPYDVSRIPDIPRLIFERNMLAKDGLLIIEHQSMQNLSSHYGFIAQRKYGYVSFSFFKAT
ncbi:MAG: RsmD family RNA methyltransferase [Sphingobacteriaceae bacterium]